MHFGVVNQCYRGPILRKDQRVVCLQVDRTKTNNSKQKLIQAFGIILLMEILGEKSANFIQGEEFIWTYTKT